VLVGVLLFLKFYAGAIDWLSWASADVCTWSIWNPALFDAVAGVVLLLIALSVRSYHMPSRGHSTLTQWSYLKFDLLPTLAAALFFIWALAAPCLHIFMANNEVKFFAWNYRATIWSGLVAGMVLYLVSWFAGREAYSGFTVLRRSLIGWIVAGAIFGILMALGVSLAHQLFTTASDSFDKWATDEIVLFIFGVPWVVMSQLVAEIVLVGLTSGLKDSDSDREWLGRVAGWMLVVAVGWLVLMALVFLGSGWVKEQLPRLQSWLVPLGGVSGLATALLGKSI
jgi:hypothetical protein